MFQSVSPYIVITLIWEGAQPSNLNTCIFSRQLCWTVRPVEKPQTQKEPQTKIFHICMNNCIYVWQIQFGCAGQVNDNTAATITTTEKKLNSDVSTCLANCSLLSNASDISGTAIGSN